MLRGEGGGAVDGESSACGGVRGGSVGGASERDGEAVPAVVCSTHVTGLWVTRALARRGVPVTVVAMDPSDLATRSRHAARRVGCGGRSLSVEDLRALLLDHAERWAGAVVIATGDIALETLSRHRDELGGVYRLAVEDWSVTRRLLRKDEMARLASRAGIDLPRNHGPLGELAAQADGGCGLRFPVVVKPNDSIGFHRVFGRKLFVARDAGELAEQARRVGEHGLGAEVLDLVPGADSLSYNYTAYVDRNGEVAAELALRKLRKSPPFFGIGRVVVTLDDETVIGELRARTLAFLREAGWRGPVSAELKLDPRNGRFVLIEVNGRCSFVQQLALHCGIDYAWLAYQDAAFGHVVPQRATAWRGALVHLHDDLLNSVVFRRVEGLSWAELSAPYRGAKAFAVWDRRDPAPFLAQWARTLKSGGRFLVSRRWRRAVRSRGVAVEGMRGRAARAPGPRLRR